MSRVYEVSQNIAEQTLFFWHILHDFSCIIKTEVSVNVMLHVAYLSNLNV